MAFSASLRRKYRVGMVGYKRARRAYRKYRPKVRRAVRYGKRAYGLYKRYRRGY